jgi:hypothetical protein
MLVVAEIPFGESDKSAFFTSLKAIAILGPR